MIIIIITTLVRYATLNDIKFSSSTSVLVAVS